MTEKRCNVTWERKWGRRTKKVHSAVQLTSFVRGTDFWQPACDGHVIISKDDGDYVFETEDPVTCVNCLRALGLPVPKRADRPVPGRSSSQATFFFTSDGMKQLREEGHAPAVPDGVHTAANGRTWTKYRHDAVEVVAPAPFHGELQIVDVAYGRSTKWYEAKDTVTGISYSMASSEMFKVLMSIGVKPGGIIPRGRWVFVKKGTAGGIGLDTTSYETSEDVNG